MSIGNIATTGMQAAMTSMSVISNNISNANTYAYKSSYANFADLYPSGNASSVQPGLGVSITGIQQNFNTGGPLPTNNKSDLAITNNGFFILRDSASGQVSYSRYGRFNFDQGYLANGNQRLQGFPAVNGVVQAGSTPSDLFINTSSIPALASSEITQVGLNLDANSVTPVTTFDPNDSSTYNFSNPATIYDSLGNPNNVDLYYIKTSQNNWTVNVYVNGSSIGTGSMVFGTNGQLSSTSGLTGLSFSPTTGAASPQAFDLLMTGATQNAKANSVNSFTTDGYPAGNYYDFSIDNNGMVNAKYDNGQTFTVGQIGLAQFQSPQGLQNIGNMSWVPTSASGNPTISISNSQNGLQPSALELSNVDLAGEMVNLVTAQNFFQANAQVEQAYNQVMQTVTKLT